MNIESTDKGVLKHIVDMLDSGARVFSIRGAAGTGKTTLIKSLIPILRNRGFDIRLMAPTGRAALILRKRTECDASTIHSCIFNIKDEPIKDDRGDALKWIFPLKADKDVEAQAFIVDESSMVGLATHDNDRELFQFGSGSLLGDLIQYSGVRTEGTTNVLFFVGDIYQLPPVGERCECPPALDEEKLEELTGCEPVVVELTEVHRQCGDSGILQEARKMRVALSTNNYSRFSIDKHDDVELVESNKFVGELNPGDSLDDKIVIAQTNVRVREYNDEIRACLGYDPKLPVLHERLLCIKNSQIHLPDGMFAEFFNGDFLRVVGVTDKLFSLEGHYRPKDSDHVFTYKYTFMKMSIEWTYEPDRGRVENIWVNVTPILLPEWDDNDGFATIGLYNGIKNLIEDKLRKEFPDFRKDRLKKTYWDGLVRKRLQESVLLRAPIVKFGYAVTGHKSQGGEWDCVWADYSFGTNQMSSYFFRWAYTVTTRAKRRLFAACVPQIDSLRSAFDALPVKATIMESLPCALNGSSETLGMIVSEANLNVIKTSELNCRMRVFVGGREAGLDDGYVDFVYKGNGRISCVEIHIPQCGDVLRQRLLAFVGRDIQSMTSTEPRKNCQQAPRIEVGAKNLVIVKRIARAIENSQMQIIQARELTEFHVRLLFATRTGEKLLDLYVSKKGRITIGSSTLQAEELSLLKSGLVFT